jgi:hypothetical protein
LISYSSPHINPIIVSRIIPNKIENNSNEPQYNASVFFDKKLPNASSGVILVPGPTIKNPIAAPTLTPLSIKTLIIGIVAPPHAYKGIPRNEIKTTLIHPTPSVNEKI